MVRGLSLFWKSTSINLDITNAKGIRCAVAKNVKRFLVKIGNEVKWIITTNSQMKTDARMKCSPAKSEGDD
mgnify:FL=1